MTKRLFLLLITFLTLSQNISFSQSQIGAVKGRVTDSITGLPVENVTVFIPYSTKGTTTNSNGEFNLVELPIGQCEIMFRHVAYQTKSVKLNLVKNQPVVLDIRVSENRYIIDEVVKEVSISDQEQGLILFRKHFLGKNCKIVNPEDLNFSFEGNIMIAQAHKPLSIINRYLGYEISYFLDYYKLLIVNVADRVQAREKEREGLNSFERFKAGWTEPLNTASTRYYQTFSGSAIYKDLAVEKPIRRINWLLNRKAEFSGSLKDFLMCLYNNKISESRYELRKCYSESEGPLSGMDSISYWDYEKDHPAYLHYNKDSEYKITDEQIGPGHISGYKELLFNGTLLVFYDNENTLNLTDDRIAEISIPSGSLLFDPNGNYIAPEGSRIWIYHDSGIKLDVLLPNDFVPES